MADWDGISCVLDGCDRPLNRDGLCFKHKIQTLNFNATQLKKERYGSDVTGGRGTREYVRDMYEQRRAAGQEDPIPANKKAAAFAPAKGPVR